jgi:ribonucleoside-diphosphate reductase alpha chain
MGEPGILYWDRISGYNVLSNTDFQYAGVNPCLTGDTNIIVFYDKNDEDKRSYVPIKDLVGKTPYVLSMNDDGDYVIGKATKVWKTKENAEIVEIITDKKNLKCTPDHRIYTTNKGWVEAQYLIKGDIIKSFWYDGKTTDSIVEKVENLNYTEDVYDMTVENYHNFLANGMVVHNCAEEPLPAGGSCLLGSLNLSTFVKDSFTESAYIDVDDLIKSVKIAVRALNDVLLEGLALHPLQEQRESVADWRQIGLGITGLGDMLIRLGETYGSDSSLKVVDNVMKNIATTAVIESLEMAKEFGCYPKCEKEKLVESTFITNLDLPQNIKDEITKYGLYNSQLLTIAPTGTLSSLLSVSSGAEPNFAFKYIRKTISLNNEDTYYEVNVPLVEEYRTITDNTELPSCFISAEQIDFKNRIKMQSVLQKYIDASISSTLNLSEDVSVEHVYNIYLEGWKNGLKGCTIWRDNCKRAGILTKEQPKNEEDNKFVGDNDAEKRPKELEADFYTIKHKGVQYTIAVGLLRGRPYEIFAYENNIEVNIEDHKGVITKIGKNHYQFKSDNICIKNLVQAANRQEERWITLTTSSQLRHREPLKCIIKTLKKMDDTITSFPNALSRVLSKYLPKQKEKMKETCPECQGELVREGGCIQCKSCGWSKCG